MRAQIKFIQKETINIDHKVFILFEGRNPVAWALAFDDDYPAEYDLMVYTRRDRRRRGYGQKLIRRARRWVHSRNRSVNFYTSPSNKQFWLSVFKPTEVELSAKRSA